MKRSPSGQPLWWLPALAIMAAIWWLSSSSDTPGPPLRHPFDWAAHFTAYFSLAYALGRATGRWEWALVLGAWFGALDEVHQAFVPGRDAGVTDWLFDLAGSGLGAWLATWDRHATRPDAPAGPDVAVLSDPPR